MNEAMDDRMGQHFGEAGIDTAARECNCLLLALNEQRLLVPRNLVAEVLPHSFLNLAQDPETGVELFDWRGRRVPLLPAAVLGEKQEAEDTDETRVAVFHGLRNREELPYYGLTISCSPRLMRLYEQDIEEVTDATLHPTELMRVMIDEGEAGIPDVDHLEDALIAMLNPTADGNSQP